MDAQIWERRLATWFGCGAAPIAPGTAGSFGALPVEWVLTRLAPQLRWPVVCGLALAGTWSADRMAKRLGQRDPDSVVIDEVVGTLLALGIASGGLASKALAFALFRLFDILKPGPIYSAQSLEPAGVGIMADDILAGVLAGVIARLLR
jgi:phosphatidylglycerophosphatase A